MNEQPPLFPSPDEPNPARRRSPNRNREPAPLGLVLTFTDGEVQTLKHNEPGPSGDLGGWGRLENWLLENTDAQRRCVLDPLHWMRLTVYYKSEAKGGPNYRVRAVCGPALRRIGIILLPGWGAAADSQENLSNEQ